MSDLAHGRPDFVLIAPRYPRPLSNGGEFIATRVRHYVAAGMTGHVLDYGMPTGTPPITLGERGVPVTALGPDRLESALDAFPGVPVLAHSPSPSVMDLLVRRSTSGPVAVWFHGYEVRDYRRLLCNFTDVELAGARRSLDSQAEVRRRAAQPLFATDRIAKVFVSRYQAEYSAFDVGIQPSNQHVIPNPIDADTYRARVRRPDEAHRILLLRSFANRNYGNDIALQALGILSRESFFGDLTITIRGFGQHFSSEVKQLRSYCNVGITEAYATRSEMALLHQQHGVFLSPSRFDTQGVTLGEAMSSGLVTITNPVCAIPEYTDEASSLLPRPDDPWAFADAIRHLIENPVLMPSLSSSAASRVRTQCGYGATIQRELDLIGGLGR